jgi:cobalt-zinc-cadmium efflux system outer membrane protein
MLFSRSLPHRAASLATAICALALQPSPVLAADPTAPTYGALLARLDDMPLVLEAAALSDAAQAQAAQARALPNPSLGWEAENVLGDGPYSGFGGAETTLTVSQPLELFGQRGARIAAARAEADATGLRSEQMRWQAASRLALAYADSEAAARRLQLAEEVLALTEQDAGAVARMVEAGREANLRGVQSLSEVQAAIATVDAARAMRDGAFARLAALALLDNVPELGDSLLDRELPFFERPGEAPLAVRLSEAEVNAANARLTMEQRRARPQVSVSAGAQRFRGAEENAFTIGVNVSVPLFDRNHGGIRAAYAQERAAQARLLAQKQEARAERIAAETTLAASASRTRAADAGLAAAEEAYRLARVGVDAGRVSQLELRASRATLIAARNAVVDARLARVYAEIDLARLEGRAPFEDAR